MSSSLLISFGPNTFALFMSSRDHLLVTLVIVYSNRWELLSAAIPVVASSKGVVRMDYIQGMFWTAFDTVPASKDIHQSRNAEHPHHTTCLTHVDDCV